jgi:hypothetical protein
VVENDSENDSDNDSDNDSENDYDNEPVDYVSSGRASGGEHLTYVDCRVAST